MRPRLTTRLAPIAPLRGAQAEPSEHKTDVRRSARVRAKDCRAPASSFLRLHLIGGSALGRSGAVRARAWTTPAAGGKTVRNHITHIFDKLGVENRAQAIVLARRNGLGEGKAAAAR